MNREAVALGTPVYTTYGGRLGGVDEALIRSGRLRPLTDPRALELQKRTGQGEHASAGTRALLVELMLGAAEPRWPTRLSPAPPRSPSRTPASPQRSTPRGALTSRSGGSI